MRYRLLGKGGLRVAEAALGTMTFGDDWGWGSPKAEAQKIYETYIRLPYPVWYNTKRPKIKL